MFFSTRWAGATSTCTPSELGVLRTECRPTTPGTGPGTRRRRILDQGQKQFFYEYDFGDSWKHEVIIEQALSTEEAPQRPVCLEGARACPPEDSGGTWGYEARLEAFRNPEDPDYVDAVERLGEDFDPEAFDLDGVNRWWVQECS
jgi:hypothetical protein